MKNTALLDEIPAKLLAELDSRNISKYKIISVNPAKGRYNLWAITDKQEEVCIKYNDPEGSGVHSFEKEKEMYRKLDGIPCVPRVIWSENVLATEYLVNSYTFREWLCANSDKDIFSVYLKDILGKYKLLMKKINDVSSDGSDDFNDDKQLEIFFDKLLFSGPYGSTVHKIEKIRNKMFRLYLTKKGVFADKIKSKKRLVHGDFHLNNILVGNNSAYIIDLENIDYGNANIELAYWYVQAWILIYENNEMVKILHEEINCVLESDLFDRSEFERIMNLYKVAIIMNCRFHREEGKVKNSILRQALKELELN